MRRYVFALLIPLFSAAPGRAAAEEYPPPLDAVALFARLAPTVLVTRAQVTYKNNDKTVTTRAIGAGVMVGHGLLLTSCHQLRPDDRDPDWIEVMMPERDGATWRAGEVRRVRRVACDLDRDLGLLADDHFLKQEQHFADATPGQSFASIGPTTLGFMWSVHRCEVAGVGELRKDSSELVSALSDTRATTLRTELPIGQLLQSSCHNQAMSGSPAFDGAGRIIGLHLFARIRNDEKVAQVDFYRSARELEAFIRAASAMARP